jgi:hypothetical protein
VNLGIAERGALLGAPVDPLLLGVDIDEGDHIRSGQRRDAAGQLRQHLPVHLAQLQHVPPGEGAQEDPSVTFHSHACYAEMRALPMRAFMHSHA